MTESVSSRSYFYIRVANETGKSVTDIINDEREKEKSGEALHLRANLRVTF